MDTWNLEHVIQNTRKLKFMYFLLNYDILCVCFTHYGPNYMEKNKNHINYTSVIYIHHYELSQLTKKSRKIRIDQCKKNI